MRKLGFLIAFLGFIGVADGAEYVFPAQSDALSWKTAVRAATTGNITLSGTQTVDSVVLAVGDRVLAKNQTAQETRGLYLVQSGAWVRSNDANTGAKLVSGSIVVVSEGGQAGQIWYLSTANPITVGTTNQTWTQFSGGGGGGGGYATIAAQGTPVTQRTTLNFASAAFSAADNAGNTDVSLASSPSNSATLVGTGRTLSAGTCISTLGDLSANRTVAVDTTCAPTMSGAWVFSSAGTAVSVTNNMTCSGTFTTNTIVGAAGSSVTLNAASGQIVNIGGSNTNGVAIGRSSVSNTINGGLSLPNNASGGASLTVASGGIATISGRTVIHADMRRDASISPAALGANATDYAPSNFATNSVLRQDVSVASATINSLAGGADGMRYTIYNISASNTLVLLHDDGSTGTAANRFLLPNAANLTIRPLGSVEIAYDGTSSRWRAVGVQ